jgi:DNA adenine methylase
MQAIQQGFWNNKPPKQLLKWIGNKHRYGERIVESIPRPFNKYVEPFVGTGAVLGILAPHRGLAGDVLEPLIGIWRLVQDDPETLIQYYARKLNEYLDNPTGTYEGIRESFNRNPNPLDLVFLSRSCYGGVVRFTREGTISTPIGVHTPISAKSFCERVYTWRERVKNTTFVCADYRETMSEASEGDVVYCDPPYLHAQSILYGAQKFNLEDLWVAIDQCLSRGARVLLSIDGQKKSGRRKLRIDIPDGLFKRELLIDAGFSMLRRFQKEGETMEGEIVHDRLLLTW